MRTLLHVIMASLFILAVQCPFAVAGFIAPTPLERAKELVKSKKTVDALSALSFYSPSHEEFSAYHEVYAHALVQLNKRFESIEHFRLAYIYAASEANKERLLLERAETYTAMGYSSEAAVCFEFFLKQFPKSNLSGRAELGIADSRYRLGEFREALAHFEKAGTSLRARYGKADALQSLGRTQEASDIYRDLIENDREVVKAPPVTLYNIGENYRQSGKLSDAKIYLMPIQDTIFKYRAAISLSLIALEENRLDAAMKFISTAAGSPERLVRREAIMNRADIQLRLKKYDEAEAALLEVTNGYPYGKQFDTAALRLAKLYRSRGKFKESIALLKTLIYRRTPSNDALDELEAIMLEAKERDQNAFMKLWNDTGRWLLDPSRSETLIKVARSIRNSGKPFFEVCSWLIRYGPENAKTDARLLLADFYADMGDAATTWEYLKHAKITDLRDDILRTKAKAYMAEHDPTNASQAVMAIREPREADMLMLLDAMNSLQNIENAVVFCKLAFKTTPPATPRTAVRFADILSHAGRTKEALEYYRTATATVKSGGADPASSAELEWAHHQIAALAHGEDSLASLKALQAANNALGRFAAAELRSAAFNKKIKQAER